MFKFTKNILVHRFSKQVLWKLTVDIKQVVEWLLLFIFRVQMYKYYTTGSALNSGFTFKVYTRGITYLIAVI